MHGGTETTLFWFFFLFRKGPKSNQNSSSFSPFHLHNTRYLWNKIILWSSEKIKKIPQEKN